MSFILTKHRIRNVLRKSNSSENFRIYFRNLIYIAKALDHIVIWCCISMFVVAVLLNCKNSYLVNFTAKFNNKIEKATVASS